MEISEKKTTIRSLLNEVIKQDHIQDYELKFNLDFIKYYGGSFPAGDMLPVLDLEAGVKGDPNHNRQWALEWLKELENEQIIQTNP